MRILIDGTMARGGGGFTYLVNIVPMLARLASDDRFLLLARSDAICAALPSAPNLNIERLPVVSAAGRLWFATSEGARIARRWNADLYFSAGETSPARAPCPTIASFRNPNVFHPVDPDAGRAERLRLLGLRALARLSVRRCERIVFVSEDSARWIGDAIGVPHARRAVIHHGIDPRPWRAARSQDRIHPRPYILSVGSVYRYKNFVRLIEAYRLLAARGDPRELPDLVLVGDEQDVAYGRKMREARRRARPLAERICLVGAVPYAEVCRWYGRAELFVFPSTRETFGHPLLEAMAAELPIVAADLPVFREIADDTVCYADPFDVDALATAMAAGLRRSPARERRVRFAAERARRFGWDRTATRLLALFASVLADRSASRPR